MIKTLVFDVGDVLTRFDRLKLCELLFPDDLALAHRVCRVVFESPLWYEGDDGSTDVASLARKMCVGYDEDFTKQAVYAISHYPDVLIRNEPAIAFLKQMKTKGYGIYLLSNYCELFERSIDKLGLLPYLDGYVYSYKEKTIKPEIRIYQILLERYGLDSKECCFIDDRPINLEGAKNAGFGYTFRYSYNDAELAAFVAANS